MRTFPALALILLSAPLASWSAETPTGAAPAVATPTPTSESTAETKTQTDALPLSLRWNDSLEQIEAKLRQAQGKVSRQSATGRIMAEQPFGADVKADSVIGSTWGKGILSVLLVVPRGVPAETVMLGLGARYKAPTEVARTATGGVTARLWRLPERTSVFACMTDNGRVMLVLYENDDKVEMKKMTERLDAIQRGRRAAQDL